MDPPRPPFHLEPPSNLSPVSDSASPTRLSFTSTASNTSDFINSYLRDSAAPPSPRSPGGGPSSSADAYAFSSSVRGGGGTPRSASPVDPSIPVGSVGLAPLGGAPAINEGLHRRSGSKTRRPSEIARVGLGLSQDAAATSVGQGRERSSYGESSGRPKWATSEASPQGAMPLHRRESSRYDASTGYIYDPAPATAAAHQASFVSDSPPSSDDEGYTEKRSQASTVASSSRIGFPNADDITDEGAGASLTAHAQIPAGGRLSYGVLESGTYQPTRRMSARGSRRYSDAGALSPAPLSKRGTLGATARALRRTSLRVVNLANTPWNSTGEHVPEMVGGVEVGQADPGMPDARTLPHRRLSDGGEALPRSAVGHGETETEAMQRVELVPRGKSLGIFGPENLMRRALFRTFRHPVTEPTILLLIIANMVVLTIQSSKSVFEHPRPQKGYFHEWEDYALFGLFCLFTLEMFARIIVAGLVHNSTASERKTARGRQRGNTFARVADKFRNPPPSPTPIRPRQHPTFSSIGSTEKSGCGGAASVSALDFGPQDPHGFSRSEGTLATGSTDTLTFPPPRRTAVADLVSDAPFRSAIARQKTMAEIAYLRHSWNRIDTVAILAFWGSFLAATKGWEQAHQLYMLRALSVLRCSRLLTITAGTTTILQSLKRAGPMLVNVTFFIFFAGALFSIIGVQSFKGSFLRNCVWIDPGGQSNYTFANQGCGGQINATGQEEGFIMHATGLPFSEAKGFLCPMGQLCIEADENPQADTQSFDNVPAAALQVAIITSANTWSAAMYRMMDAEYFPAAAFFIVCLLLLFMWLANLLVAVITNTFSEIVDETKHSAFSCGPAAAPHVSGTAEAEAEVRRRKRPNFLRKVNDKLHYFWVAIVLSDFGFQAARTAHDTVDRQQLLNDAERYFTLALDVEILLRAAGYLPDWRVFFNGKNIADLFLAIITTIIQIPFIRDSSVYPWLTFFQIVRFFRVIAAVPRMDALLRRLRGSFKGLVNMILFLLGMNFVASLIAVQYFRGAIEQSDHTEMTFYQFWNAFLAMYQVFSSENWTDVLYAATSAKALHGQAWVAALFLTGWFLFANFVMLQMFIAVISEGFEVAEEEKREEQLRLYRSGVKPEIATAKWYQKFNPYRFVKAKNEKGHPGFGAGKPTNSKRAYTSQMGDEETSRFVWRARRALHLDLFAAQDLEHRKSEDGRSTLDLLTAAMPRSEYGKLGEHNEARAEQLNMIAAHPSYDNSLWIFSQRSWIRQKCQHIVDPSYGERLLGQPTKRLHRNIFNLLMLLTIAASVSVAGIATPVYRQTYYREHGDISGTWFDLTELSLGSIFIVEFVIKVIADGFAFTPNAYLLSVWNGIDFFVLITLIADLLVTAIFGFGASRLTRSLKAFRALRLINLSERMRQTFYNVIILGFGSLVDASVLTILYIMPFAVWGINIFAGLLYQCNDGNATGKASCLGEYSNAPLQWEFLMPRTWENPYVYSFDSFRTATLILFEIISLEGWINVMQSLMSIKGRDQQPQQDASQANAIYALVYNLIGAVVILTLFLAVIINNFLRRSGSAFLTSEQQQWINLRRLIMQQRPSKRPKARPRDAVRQWCYDRATHKHGWWSRMMTGLYILHITVLLTQTRANTGTGLDNARNATFLAFGLIYVGDICIRLFGLGWISFKANRWNLYDIITVSGMFSSTISLMLAVQSNVAAQFQKLFLVCIAFRAVSKSNALNQLFKTAIASLPSIASLFALWVVLFLVWGLLFVENFSLTRSGPSSLTRNSNYQSLSNALIMLSIQSTGEGWNGFMHDYTVTEPYCVSSPNFLFNDCGSPGWAFALFISWNVMSMYIVLNLFTGLVVENFAFVYQLYGKVRSLNREEVRRFKKVWSDFDKMRTGYLKREDYIPFFARLSGAFSVSIYPQALRVQSLKQACTRAAIPPKSPLGYGQVQPSPELGMENFDFRELEARLSALDGAEIRRRKARLNQLYQEALITEREGRGMAFTNMMLMLAHYTLIEDETTLRIEELIKRRELMERVEDNIRFERIKGLFLTLTLRRKFLAHVEAKRRKLDPSVPAIFVQEDNEPGGALPKGKAAERLRLTMASMPGFRTPPASPTNRSPGTGWAGTPGSTKSTGEYPFYKTPPSPDDDPFKGPL